MSKVNKMGLKDILEKIDLIMKPNDIVFFCNNIDVIREFMQKYNTKHNDVNEVKEFLISNEEYMDKEKLILLIVLNYKNNLAIIDKIKENLTKEFSREKSVEVLSQITKFKLQYNVQKDRLQSAIKLGKGIETFLTFYYYDEKEKRYKIEVADSREIIDGKKVNTSKNIRRFDEIDLFFKDGNPEEELGIEFVIQSILLTDLYGVFPTERFGIDIRTMILENEILRKGIKNKEQLQVLKTLENCDEYTNLLDNVPFEGILPGIKATLREYSPYIDLDKLLLVSAYRFNETLESRNVTKQMSLNAKWILQGILENIQNSNSQISCELQRKTDNLIQHVEYSTKDLKKCLTQFTENGYIATKKIEEYKRKVNSQEISLSQIDPENIEIIFSQSELENLSTLSPGNLIYVFQKYKWDTTRIIELYESNAISLEYLRVLKENINLHKDVSFEQLNSYYQEMKEQPEDEIILTKYENYLNLYKEIFINGRQQQEIEESSSLVMEKIAEMFEEQEYEEVVKNYFKAGIITIDSIAEWSNENIITTLLTEGLISLQDVQRLVVKQKLHFNYLSNIYYNLIKNDNIEYDKRLDLIRTGFADEKDIFDLYKRNLLFEEDLKKLAKDGIVRKDEMQRIINSRTMEELEKNSAIRLTGLNSLTKKNNEIYFNNGNVQVEEGKTKPTGKFIIDPNEREKFIRLLKAYKANTDLNEDSPFYNYEFYVIPDESGTIGLNSVVIAERYFEDKNIESRFATDNATYFFKYKDLMVLSNLRKSEMTKERKNIVFTANHVIANEKREGRWAKSVISSLAKTMMSLDLKEYSKKNQKVIVLQKLKDIYSTQELGDILDMATEIDFGEYIYEIQEPIVNIQSNNNVTSSGKKPENISDDDECR